MMNKLQKAFYWAGVAFSLLSAYTGLQAFSSTSSPVRGSEEIAIIYAGQIIGLGVTALAFAVLALVCFKAAEMKP